MTIAIIFWCLAVIASLIGIMFGPRPKRSPLEKKEFKLSEVLDDFIEHKYIDKSYDFCNYVSHDAYGVSECEFCDTIKKVVIEYVPLSNRYLYEDYETHYNIEYRDYRISVFVHTDDIRLINSTLKAQEEQNKQNYCNTILKERLK